MCDTSVDRKVNEYPKDARVIHLINQCISLKDEDIRKNNEILKAVLNEVIAFLKCKDSFFRDYFQNIVFAGSYYKGTKVGTPDEFDLNLVIRLPVKYGSIKFEQDVPGYTKLKLCDDSFLSNWSDHKKLLPQWTSGSYLRHDKFRQWMESLFSSLPRHTSVGYELKVSKSGPAFTLLVFGRNLKSPISVDLVPVLEFRNNEFLHEKGIDGVWYAVPKPIEADYSMPEVQWRISFYTLEKCILKQYENGYMKPVIRQIKKLRDKFQWNFASYYIETLFLREIKSARSLQNMGEVRLFVHMLKRMKEACESRKILNYWDSKHNLIEHLPAAQLANMAGLLSRIIKEIIADPLTIAKFVLTDEELRQIQKQLD